MNQDHARGGAHTVSLTSRNNHGGRIFELGDRNDRKPHDPGPDITGIDLGDSPPDQLPHHGRCRAFVLPAWQPRQYRGSHRGQASGQPLLSDQNRTSNPSSGIYFVPEHLDYDSEIFRESGLPMALVTDEYGIRGVVTLHDILESIVGGVRNLYWPEPPPIIVREDGSWLIDGDVVLDDLDEIIPVDDLPGKGSYQTLAGFLMYALQRIPTTGDHTVAEQFRFEVVDMDGNRVDKVLVSKVEEPNGE